MECVIKPVPRTPSMFDRLVAWLQSWSHWGLVYGLLRQPFDKHRKPETILRNSKEATAIGRRDLAPRTTQLPSGFRRKARLSPCTPDRKRDE